MQMRVTFAPFLLRILFIVALIYPLTATSQISKFELVGSTLIYDTFASSNEQEQEITWDDVYELEALLK